MYTSKSWMSSTLFSNAPVFIAATEKRVNPMTQITSLQTCAWLEAWAQWETQTNPVTELNVLAEWWMVFEIFLEALET